MTTATLAPFQFDGDYKNNEQVRPYFAAFLKRYNELAAQGLYPYNDRFKGHIPGIEGPNEDTAIYLLQVMRRLDKMKENIAAFGGRKIESLALGEVIRGDIAHFGFYSCGTGWQVFEGARLVGGHHGNVSIILKGKRNPSHYTSLANVLVR